MALIKVADERMYENKRAQRRNRRAPRASGAQRRAIATATGKLHCCNADVLT